MFLCRGQSGLVVASKYRCCFVHSSYLLVAYTFQNPATPLKCTSNDLGDISNYSMNKRERDRRSNALNMYVWCNEGCVAVIAVGPVSMYVLYAQQ